MQLPFSTLLALAATTFASCDAAKSVLPPLTHIFTAKVTAGEGIPIGVTYRGNRTALPLTGGTFTGLINGTVLPIGADFGIIRSNGGFSPDGISIFKTNDGANLLFKDRGFESKDGYVYGSGSFETGVEKYAWLNNVIIVTSAKLSTDGDSNTNVGLEVFCVGPAGP